MAIAKYRGANGSSNLARITKTMAKIEIKEMVKYEAEFSSVVEACVRKNAPEPLIAAVFSH